MTSRPGRTSGCTRTRYRAPVSRVDKIQERGFDGLALWENHILRRDESELHAIASSGFPVAIYKTKERHASGPFWVRARLISVCRSPVAVVAAGHKGADPLIGILYLLSVSRQNAEAAAEVDGLSRLFLRILIIDLGGAELAS